MKKVLELAGKLLELLSSPLVQLAVVGIVGLLIWRKIFGAATVADTVNNTIDAAATLPGGVKSLIGSTINGETAATYITSADQQRQAAERLALIRASKAQQLLAQEEW